jgi:hypothetical protein
MSCQRPARSDAAARDRAVARRQRQEWNEEPSEEAVEHERRASPAHTQVVQRGSRTIKRIRQGGCWFRTRDVDAGIRAYEGERGAKRFWHGYYGGKAICHFTGRVIPSVDSASTQEWDLFPLLYDRVSEMAGKPPESAIGDKGLSIASCFERRFTDTGERIAAKLAEKRLEQASVSPTGPMAAALGIGEVTPPSRRPRGAPPGKP